MNCPVCESKMDEDALIVDNKEYPCWFCLECGWIVRRIEEKKE